MRKLDEILKDIKANKEIAATDLDTIPWSTRTGWLVNINQAKTKIKELEKEFGETALAKSIVFFPTGDNQQEFADLGTKLGKSLVIDGNALYEFLTDRIESSIGHHRQIGINQLMALNQTLQDMSKEMYLTRPVHPESVGDITLLPDHQSIVNYVKKVIVHSNDYKYAMPYLTNLIYNKALDVNFSNKVLTVVILNTNQTDQTNYSKLFTKSVVVDTNQEITEEFVNKIYKEAFKITK